jgi:hypothetical protein
MPLDTSIALNARLPQIESPLNQMANFASMRQAQQANALNELKMQETQRGMAENEAVRNYFASQDPTSANFARGLYGISPERGAAFEKSRAELAKDKALTGKTTAETEETKFKVVEKRLNILGQGFGAVRNNPTPETAMRVLKYVRDNGAITDEQFQAYTADIMANPDPARIKQMADEGFTAALSAKEQLPSFQMQTLGGTSRMLGVNPVTGEATVAAGSEGRMTATPGDLLSAETQRLGQEITKRGQDITASTTIRGQNLTNARELQRIEIEKGKNSPEAIAMRSKMTEVGKADAKFEANAPQAIATAKVALTKIDELLASPGLSSAVGMGGIETLGIPGIAKFIPGTDAADFKARLDEVLGGAFMEAFNTLKGGGQITEKEGEKATAAITRMSTSQSEKEFIKAAKDFQEVIKSSIKKSEARLGGTAGGGVDTNNPLLKNN